MNGLLGHGNTASVMTSAVYESRHDKASDVL